MADNKQSAGDKIRGDLKSPLIYFIIPDMAIRVYTSKNCPPCKEIDRLVKGGRFDGVGEIELVDIESDDGFAKFKEEVLDFGDGAVPSAYKEGKKCIISFTEDDSLSFNCPTDPSSSEQD